MLPVRDRVLDALRAHVTQVQAIRAVDDDRGLVACYALSNRILAPVLPTEAYRRGTGRLGCGRRLARRRPPGNVTRVQRLSAGAIGSAVAALLLGVLVGTLGTVMHRSIQPWGVVVCLTLAFVAAVTVRAWAGFVALAGYALGLVVTVLVLTQSGPGGDILVPDGQAIGWVWLLGSVAVDGRRRRSCRAACSTTARGRRARATEPVTVERRARGPASVSEPRRVPLRRRRGSPRASPSSPCAGAAPCTP